MTGATLVTGAAGCIGAWVVARLARDGVPVIAFDLSDDRRRLRMALDDDRAMAVPWVTGDVAELPARLPADVGAIIHLAALQIPSCKADPIGGARVNVVGHTAVFEAARQAGLDRVVYASSVAALPRAAADDHPATLYGVFKRADEGIARVYWRDWGIASIGLRPHTVYGPGRDQGLTSAPTKAMVAAVAGRDFTIPFSGGLMFQFVEEVAEAFVRAQRATAEGAHVHDLKGEATTVEAIIAAIRGHRPDARIRAEGPPLPVRAAFDDRPLRRLIGDWRAVALEEGVGRSLAAFPDLIARGLVTAEPS
ncbi:MAG: NAD-dependent epimerase/dehydratase family protein [Alphaproteobacteria bacterium]